MADVFDEIAPDEAAPAEDIFDQIEAEKPVVRDVPRGTLEPTDLFPGIRKMGGEIVPGQLGETHQDIIKREGINAEDLDQRVFVTHWGDVIDREGAANAVFPKVIPQFEPGRLHSTDLNALQTPGEFEKRFQMAGEEAAGPPPEESIIHTPDLPMPKEVPVSPEERITQQLVMPELTQALGPEAVATLTRETYNLAKTVPEFFTSLPGLAAMAGGRMFPTATAGFFTADMLKSLGNQLYDTYKNWGSMSFDDKIKAFLDAAATTAMTLGAAKGTAAELRAKIKAKAPPTERPGEAPLAAPTEGKAEVGEVVQAAPTEPAITTDKTVLPEKQVELRTPSDIAKELGIEAQESVGNFDRYLFKHKKNAEQLSVPKGSGPEVVKAQMEKALARWITPDEILKASEEEIKSIPQGAELSDRIGSEMTEEQLKASEPIIVDYLKKQIADRKLLDEGKIGVEEYAQRVMAPRTKGKLLVDVFAGLKRPLPEVPVEAKPAASPDMGLPATAAAPVAQEPAIVGMGGAVPGEFKHAAATPTGIKNATVDAERAKRGLPPAIQPVRRSFGEVWDRAMAKIDNDPGYPDRLIGELRNKPRALTDAEDATILHRQIDLQNEYAKATRDLAQAYDDGRMLDVANEQARVAGLSDQLLDLYNIGKSVGTETGRGLAARRMMAYEDYSLAKMELDKRMANGGRPLTDAERNEVVRLNKKIEQTQQAHDEYVANTDARVSGQETTKAINEIVVKAAKERKAKKPRTPEQITADEAKTKANIKLRLDEGKKSQISSMVQKLARVFVERGIRERDALIDAVHGVLKDIDPAFTRRETMDAISGYGDFRQLTKDEISVKLRDLKGQMQQVAKLEDMQASRPPLKTGLERRIPSPEESRLIKLVNQAKNEFQIPISDEATQLKSSLDTLKTRLRNRTIELKGMLERKEFAKKPKRIIQRDAEANRLHFEMTKAKIAWHEALMKDRLANRSVPKKVFDFGVELLNTSRAILTSLDLSAVLRQGGFIAFAHPMRALKSFPAMFRAFASEKGQHAANLEIANRKNFPLYNQSKLYLSEHGQKLSQMEEAYMSRWADKIPLVAGSQRAYVTFLNKLRVDSFDAMANSLGRSGELSPVEANAIANFVNVATGRGNFGMKENALVGLNTVFFAPRYVASRFQLIAGQPMYRGTARTRAAVAKEYGRFLIGAGLVYALAQLDGATVETDPRSADFGKLRYGNTRIDPMAGLLQSTVLLGRLGSGQVKTTTGKIVPIRGEKIPYGGATAADVTGRFLRSKLSPALGTGLNLLTGKDVVGQPVTLGSTAQNLLVPLSLQDVYDTMKEQGVPHGTIMMLLSTFGMGLQNYQDKNTKAPVIAKKDIFDTL